jgi:anti-sigma factor RsiW
MNAEHLTAYMDGELSDEEQLLLEEQLRTDPELLLKMKIILRDELLFAEHFAEAWAAGEPSQECSTPDRHSTRAASYTFLDALPNEELLTQYVGGQLTDEQERELEEQLNSSEILEKEFSEFCRQRCLIAEALGAADAIPKRRVLKIGPSPYRPPLMRPSKPRGAPWIRIAAAIAIMLVGGWFFNRSLDPFGQIGITDTSSDEPIAVMTVTQGEVAVIRRGTGTEAASRYSDLPAASRVGQGSEIQLHDRDLIVTGRGLAVVTYKDGTSVHVRSYSQASLSEQTGDKRLMLYQGFAKANVSKQPHGLPMIVSTPQAEITVLGTAFMLETSEVRTDLEMTEGVVAVSLVNSDKAVRVSAGETLTATDGQLTLSGQEPRVISFSLIDTDAKKAVPQFDPIEPGAIIELAQLEGKNLTIRANTIPKLMSEVILTMKGPNGYPELKQTEHYYPYLVTDNNTESHWIDATEYVPMPPLRLGSYTISATATHPRGKAATHTLGFEIR